MTKRMKELELDTIYWYFDGYRKMYYDNISYEITQTKHHEWRVWNTRTQTQVSINGTVLEGQQSAELDKQSRGAILTDLKKTLLNPQGCQSDCNEDSLGSHFNI